MAGTSQDKVSLFNQRCGRGGTGLLVHGGTGTSLAHLLVTGVCSVGVWEIRQADRQISHFFAYGGGKSFLTGKSALSPGSESQADMPVIWAILQERYPGFLSERGVDAQLPVIGADLLAGCWSECDSLPHTRRLHMARR